MLAKITCLAVLVSTVLGQGAIVKIEGPGVKGSIRIRQFKDGVELQGTITGLKPGEHGFHVHKSGDLSNGCASTGGHFNPANTTHGGPNDVKRHVGDLGNIEADSKKVAHVCIVDTVIALEGPNSIIGRAIVVHADPDDFGKGGHNDSLTTGHAGARVACGIIALF